MSALPGDGAGERLARRDTLGVTQLTANARAVADEMLGGVEVEAQGRGQAVRRDGDDAAVPTGGVRDAADPVTRDRKSTRLNSSHMSISYAVFCLKKKKNKT